MSLELAAAGDVELCIRAIAARLYSIREENGFRCTVKKVYRSFLNLENLDSNFLPAIQVGRTPGDRVEFEQWLDSRGYNLVVPISMIGAMRYQATNAEDGQAATRAEAFVSDLVKLQMADPLWGTPRQGAGCIKESWLLSNEHSAEYDSSGIYVELLMKFKTTIDGVNP